MEPCLFPEAARDHLAAAMTWSLVMPSSFITVLPGALMEEAAYLQSVISRSTAALRFKRKQHLH